METRIREYRKLRRMTLQELADKIGTTPQTVQRLETANMTVSTDWLQRFADVFGVHPADLLRGGKAREISILGVLGPGAILRSTNPLDVTPFHMDIPADDPVAVRLDAPVGNYLAGTVVVGNKLSRANIVNAFGADCLVGMPNGTVMLRRVIRGEGDRVTLVPLDNQGEVQYDQEPEWVARVVLTINYH